MNNNIMLLENVDVFIPNALMSFRGISQGAKLAWAKLAQHAGEKGEAYSDIETLAHEVGTQKRQCVRYIQELEKNNLIKVIRPEGVDKLGHKTNCYIFLWNEIYDTAVVRESVERESIEKESHTKEKKGRVWMEEKENNFIGLPKLIKYLNLSRIRICKLIKHEKLPYYKLGNRYYFKLTEIDEYLSSKKLQ